ncbi:MAG: hypothetical protein QG652_1547 [Pseudomonadota bacterium]|nr:hypothetical protein [Pseudomonadota bacterium]
MFHLLFLDAPAALRRDSRLFWLATLVFFLSVVFAFIIVQINAQAVLLIYDEQQLADFRRMYHPEWQVMMMQQRSSTGQFIFYLLNNNWVGIQLFLFGAMLGVGTLLFLGYTGFSLGLMIGYLSAAGYSNTLWPTIMAHSSFEILAILLAAVAGMKWGFSLVLIASPVRRREFGLRFAQSVLLLLNAIIFFAFAALIEAYWSSGFIASAQTKYIAGTLSWIILTGYFLYFSCFARKDERG